LLQLGSSHINRLHFTNKSASYFFVSATHLSLTLCFFAQIASPQFDADLLPVTHPDFAHFVSVHRSASQSLALND
jgi:hypothetical protein